MTGRVTGIGGVFFKAQDQDALRAWYAEHLGIGGEGIWQQEAGPTEFAPFGPDHWESPYLGPTGWGINLRVDGFDELVARLRGAGIDVEVDPGAYDYGRFALLRDPEGNVLQLWEPA